MLEFLYRFGRNRAATFGICILAVITAIALAAPFLFPRGPFELVGKPMVPPMRDGFVFGTDLLGRNIAVGMAFGARTSLLIGIVASAVAVFLGFLIGGICGYYGGKLDSILMRVTELFQTVPSFLFTIVIVAILGPTVLHVIIGIAAVTWPPVARLARGEFFSMRNREFVHACVCAGVQDWKVILFHLLPNCAPAIVVTGSLMVANAVLTESSLAFLGLGDPNVMSWGLMIGAGRVALRMAWWICAIPGIAIVLTAVAINLVGDGLNDSMNPRLRNV